MDVKIVKGKDLVCIEGCQNNTLSLLQLLAYDTTENFKRYLYDIRKDKLNSYVLSSL